MKRKTGKCNCDLCKRNRKFVKTINRLKESVILEKDVKWLEDLYNHLIDIEESYDILKQQYKVLSEKAGYKAYLDGTIKKINVRFNNS